ncbi:MAG: DnaJ domain-containing protein, partial [Gammaproteobacteria bacterium]|nr:DnaJ domain-containing protein [Gammaproteobacteria bacterium]
MAFKDYYAILGIPPGASHEAVRLAFRRLARQYHPDLNREVGAEERFKAINEAYDVLSDPAKRAAYDQMRQQVQVRSDLGSASRRSFEDLLASFASLNDKALDPGWREMLRGFFTDAGLTGRGGRSGRGEDQHAT